MSLEKKIQREVEQSEFRMVKMFVEEHDKLVQAFTEVLKFEGYGKKRMNRVIGRLNERLPEHLQLKERGNI